MYRQPIVPLGYDILASQPRKLSAQVRTEVAKRCNVLKDAAIRVE